MSRSSRDAWEEWQRELTNDPAFDNWLDTMKNADFGRLKKVNTDAVASLNSTPPKR